MRKYRGIILLVVMIGTACVPPAAVTPSPVLPTVVTATPLPPTATNTPEPPTATPTITPTFTPTEEGVVNANINPSAENVYLFASPGASAEVLRIMRGSAPMTLIGRTEDQAWVEATFADGVSGWLLTASVQTSMDVMQLAITGEASEEPLPEVVLAPDLTPTFVSDAQVQPDAGGLRIRELPSTEAEILGNLDELTQLSVFGRTIDNTWLRVQTPDGLIGWVASSFLDVNISLNQVAVIQVPTPLPQVAAASGDDGGSAAVAVSAANAVSGIGEQTREIFRRGQEMGNRANVFSKVGDLLTALVYMFYPIGEGTYNLGQYSNLQETVAYFSAENARVANSFANISLAAGQTWTSGSVLDPANANPENCQPGETPLACEYRVVRPAVALIMFGTYDVEGVSVDTYRANLERIAQMSVDMGVIPVFSTIPTRPGFDVTPYNQAVRAVAGQFGTPLWDYFTIMQAAPNRGLADDGSELPSVPDPDNVALSANFSGGNLQYGFPLRNLSGLQVLDALRLQVLTGN